MPKDVYITAKDNPAVKRYRKLRDQKKARRAEGLFVAEGLRIVADALRYPAMVQQLFVTDTAWAHHGDALTAAQESGMLLRISDAVGETMHDTAHGQGVFAVCRVPERAPLETVLRPEGRYLVLCGLQDPGNMGMILRTADALGIEAVLSAGSCELFAPKVVRAAMGSVLRVPVYETDDALGLAAMLAGREIVSFAAVPAQGADVLRDGLLGDGCAVWIGNEGSGLPQDVIDACGRAVTIPMSGGPESLNAAMAAGILMWEMRRQ